MRPVGWNSKITTVDQVAKSRCPRCTYSAPTEHWHGQRELHFLPTLFSLIFLSLQLVSQRLTPSETFTRSHNSIFLQCHHGVTIHFGCRHPSKTNPSPCYISYALGSICCYQSSTTALWGRHGVSRICLLALPCDRMPRTSLRELCWTGRNWCYLNESASQGFDREV